MKEKCNAFSLRSLTLKPLQLLIVSAFLLMNCFPVMAQQSVRVKGVVTSSTDGYSLPGVNVVQKGTTNGIVTDIDGNFELTVPAGAQLDFSYIGFLNQQVTVTAGKTIYNIVLKEDSQSLDEVVVVGYGVQKKKLVTGATVQVGSSDIQKLSTTSTLGALQSQSPGVNITQSSGKPGDNFKVTIRGLGTIGNAGPLYVIDGVVGGDINNLNPGDIESIDVLKDAASAAIYGSRAANGVILVTTRQGKSGKVQLSYDGYVGQSSIYKKPALLTAKEYMVIQDETRFNEGNGVYNWANEIPGYLLDQINNGSWKGTNWLDESVRDGITQNHSINLTGGSETSKFAMGFSYTSTEGTVAKQLEPVWQRYTGRINSEHVLLKSKGFDVITIGENLTFSHRSNTNDIRSGNIFWNTLNNLLKTTPLLPVYNQDGGYYDQDDKSREGWNLQGSIGNPIASYVSSTRNFSRNYSLDANAYIEIQPIKNLKFRSIFGYRQSAYTSRSYSGIHNLSTTDRVTEDEINQSAGGGYSVSLNNTLSYSLLLNNVHAFDAVIGQSFEQSGMGDDLSLGMKRSIFPDDFSHAYLDNAKPTGLTDYTTKSGAPWGPGRIASFFGRVNYNYKETYMATAIIRADGSSNFARGHRWGYFPSVSAGWVITNEAFMESVRDTGLDFLKIRGSWGQNGNQDIDGFQYLATIAMDNRNAYFFGDSKESQTTGAYADILPNPDVSWETSQQLDLGFDARLLNSRLGINFDWYNKTTKDWLVRAPILATYGTGAPYINGGEISNKGVELALSWNDHVGDFTYGVNFNISKNTNEVTKIANTEGIIHGATDVLSQGTTEMFRAQVGFPAGYFWGYKTDGIFQNQAQIEEYRAAGKGVLETAQPGDVIFVDNNHDGGISNEDKVMIGNPHPDIISGFTLNLGYKGFDFAVTAFGQFGMQIAKSYRSFADSPLQNYTTEIFGRWHGEGTSNKLPRMSSGSHTNFQYISDIYIEDGDFVKIQNVTLGYDFKKLFRQLPFAQLRLYVAAQNLFTFTGYSGMDPEVGWSYDNAPYTRGIDLGLYPASRNYLVGVNVKF